MEILNTNIETLNKSQLSKYQNNKQFDLELRTLEFARNIRKFIKLKRLNFYIIDDIKQLLRSSGSIGANYIEANEALSKRDFLHRIKISKKEVKETIYWLNILSDSLDGLEIYIKECLELQKIFGSIYNKSK